MAEAAAIFDRVLQNTATEAQRNVVVANAAFAIRTLDPALPIDTCIGKAHESLASGAAFRTLQKFISLNS